MRAVKFARDSWPEQKPGEVMGEIPAELDLEALRCRQCDHCGIEAEIPAIVAALEQAETAYQRGMEDQVVADNHSWEAGERELEAMTALRDQAQERAERLEKAARDVLANRRDLEARSRLRAALEGRDG